MTGSTSERDLLESMVKERDEKIRSLEQVRAKQEMSLISLRSELHQMRIKQREESYWHRIDMDKVQLQKDATEKRMSELEKQMHEDSQVENVNFNRVPLKLDRRYVAKLQTQLTKSMQTIGILDNQVTLVKKSCDEIIRSLKLDMTESLEDKSKIEIDLLNQLSKLDNQKQIMEDEFRIQLQERQGDITNLQKEVERLKTEKNELSVIKEDPSHQEDFSNVDDDHDHSDDESVCEKISKEKIEEELSEVAAASVFKAEKALQKELMKQLESVTREKDAMEEDLRTELKERREKIEKLGEANAQHEQTIERLEKEKAELRKTIAAEFEDIMQMLIEDRQESFSSLERVAAIQEKVESSIRSLGAAFDKVKRLENNGPDHKKLSASTLNKASLLHKEIKLSLNLVELKLKNQLEKLKNNELFLSLGAGVSVEKRHEASTILNKTKEIQEEAISSMRIIEKNGMNHFKKLEDEYEAEIEKLKDQLNRKSEDVVSMEKTINDLEKSLLSLRNEMENPQEDNSPEVYASQSTMKKLQEEVFTVVERVKEKNHAICKLTTNLEEHKVREAALKKELKRLKKKVKLMEADDALTALERSAMRSEF